MQRGGSVDHHLRAFAKLAPLLDVVSAKVDVAVVQVVTVQQLASLIHDLIYQLFGRVELVLEGCLLSLRLLSRLLRSEFLLFVFVCFQIGCNDFGVAFSAVRQEDQ